MDITLWHYVTIFILICFSGFIDSIAGGGGLIAVPTYLAVGLPAEFILGTNKCVGSTGALLAAFRYIKGGAILWRIIPWAVVAALIGSSIGASLSRFLSRELMFGLLLIAIPCIFFLQYRQQKVSAARKADRELPADAVLRAAIIGLLFGGYDGIFGPGTGTFILLAFVSFLNFTAQQASANARLINCSSNLAAFFYFLLQGHIYWPVAVVAITGSLLGNWIGSGMVLKNADRVVMPVFRLVLGLLMVKCAWDLFG